jgi:hypothetical protein
MADQALRGEHGGEDDEAKDGEGDDALAADDRRDLCLICVFGGAFTSHA